MSDSFTDDDMEAGRVDPEAVLNGDARHEDAPTQSEEAQEGTATREDMRQGRVDPSDVLDGTTTIGGESGGDVTQMNALDYLKEEKRDAYEAEAETGEVVVHLSGDESLDTEVEEWAEEHGVTTKSPE